MTSESNADCARVPIQVAIGRPHLANVAAALQVASALAGYEDHADALIGPAKECAATPAAIAADLFPVSINLLLLIV
eukprot:scaffold360446_cov41-Prasinocladus_malaysianus.AAC.1